MNRQPDQAQQPVSEWEVATLGGGCFWCLEAVFSRVRGVQSVESGYSNGHVLAPTYEEVCSGQTGHAEVVRLTFDPAVITYQQVLTIFMAIHDPCSLNRQGNDVGTQYRSGIYTHDDRQQAAAQALLAAYAAGYARPIVTEVLPVLNYHRAEETHQRYFEHHPGTGYCAFVVAPKVAHFQQQFPNWLLKE